MIKSYFNIISELSKIRITVMVAVTTLTGYILARKQVDLGILLPATGIFLLACGSSVLNHLQEKRTDAFMARTKNRPLPSGKVTKTFALLVALTEIIAGTAILYAGSDLEATLLGLTALLWYNGIYTPLKKVTPNAVIPGSVIGAIPPLVGWVAGGGNLWSPQALFIAIFFFVWQVPHFYLLAVKFSDQYKAAGFPVITEAFSEKAIIILIYIWILTTTISTFFLKLEGLVTSNISAVLIIISAIWLNYQFLKLLVSKKTVLKPGKYFMKINYFVLVVVIILSVDHLLI